jgi:CCR4-NOT transcription complex subunit 1
MDTSWSKLIMEIGYSFTQTIEECKAHLMKGGGRDVTAQDVSKIISLMCQTHANLSDSSINLPTPNAFWPNSSQTNDPSSNVAGQGKEKLTSIENTSWKPEIFVQALKEVVPNLNWKEVCLGLDHPEFVIKDRAGLNLLITIIRLGFQSSGMGQNFPAECIYRHWTNVEGQLTLITAILKNSDIYSFADHIYSAIPVEVLKTPPELDNKEIAAWKSVHLVEVLLYISENGCYNQVLEILKIPLQHCPDILFMALLHSNGPLTVLRQELFTTLVPIFLSNHPNSGPILHQAWNSANFSNTLKSIIMNSMSEWYIRSDSDQSRLSRILDVAQDLKALSNLLNSRSFMFVIDLACLASRREYLKLDKWLSDKLREHGDQFAAALIKFLQRRCPIMGKVTEEQISKSGQLQPETLNVIVQCLHAFIPNIHSPEVAEQANTIVANCNLLLKRRFPQPNMLRSTSHMGMDPPFGSNNQVFQPGMNLNDISASMNTLNLNAVNPNSNAFNAFGNMLGNTPASPSRLMSALGSTSSNSPFPMQINAPQNMSRMGTTPTTVGDKHNILNPLPNQNPSSQQSLFVDQPPISSEIEEEANGYFQRIYNHPPHPTLSIDEVLDMLKRFSESSNRREKEVHYCMLRNLLEEYKFFPQYPDKELQITAQLFGGMIDRNLVDTYLTLGIALRYVLDALKKPAESKMYYFGVTALDRFKNKLHTYHKYCDHVRSIPHFNQFPPHLIKFVEYGCNSEMPPDAGPFNSTTSDPSGQLLPNALSHLPMTSAQSLYRSNSVTGNIVTQAKTTASTATTPSATMQSKSIKSIANATNIDTLLVANESENEKIVMPPDAVQDKTAFIFNNLSQLNLASKCEEIKEILLKEYYPWMSQYLVLKRASIEINFHTLYSNFLDALKMPELLILTTNETFRNIKVGNLILLFIARFFIVSQTYVGSIEK